MPDSPIQLLQDGNAYGALQHPHTMLLFLFVLLVVSFIRPGLLSGIFHGIGNFYDRRSGLAGKGVDSLEARAQRHADDVIAAIREWHGVMGAVGVDVEDRTKAITAKVTQALTDLNTAAAKGTVK